MENNKIVCGYCGCYFNPDNRPKCKIRKHGDRKCDLRGIVDLMFNQ